MVCRICSNSQNNTTYVVREMMFGMRDSFEYFQCAECECLQIAEFPGNIDAYYPRSYYSYWPAQVSHIPVWKRMLARQKTRLYLRGFNVKNPGLPEWVKKSGIKTGTHILDVGCGQGELLLHLHRIGFMHLTGIDPYISEDCIYGKNVSVYRKQLHELNGKFGFIMLNHSFEHMSDPVGSLKEMNRLLGDNGLLLIRIPVVSSYAWRRYKTNWVQLDAPRHYFLHSLKSMGIVAAEAGFLISDILYDSGPFQFYGSELYARDIALCGEDRPVFTQEELEYNVRKAYELNKLKDGDQACFFLKRKNK